MIVGPKFPRKLIEKTSTSWWQVLLRQNQMTLNLMKSSLKKTEKSRWIYIENIHYWMAEHITGLNVEAGTEGKFVHADLTKLNQLGNSQASLLQQSRAHVIEEQINLKQSIGEGDLRSDDHTSQPVNDRDCPKQIGNDCGHLNIATVKGLVAKKNQPSEKMIKLQR